jgi:uncharacterized membrane protein YeaQ/YmgE (transglycosylase-associated protein family)
MHVEEDPHVVLASITLSPGNILAWLIAGLIAGALAGRVARGRGFGCIGDIVVGLVGAFVGGLILTPLIHGARTVHFIGTILVAFIGAVAVIVALRLIRAAL